MFSENKKNKNNKKNRARSSRKVSNKEFVSRYKKTFYSIGYVVQIF